MFQEEASNRCFQLSLRGQQHVDLQVYYKFSNLDNSSTDLVIQHYGSVSAGRMQSEWVQVCDSELIVFDDFDVGW